MQQKPCQSSSFPLIQSINNIIIHKAISHGRLSITNILLVLINHGCDFQKRFQRFLITVHGARTASLTVQAVDRPWQDSWASLSLQKTAARPLDRTRTRIRSLLSPPFPQSTHIHTLSKQEEERLPQNWPRASHTITSRWQKRRTPIGVPLYHILFVKVEILY